MASGTPSRFRSSVNAIRSCCGHCGTQLTFQSDECSDAIDITMCSLDHPEAVSPRDHTYMSRKLPWIHLSDGLAQYSQARPGAARRVAGAALLEAIQLRAMISQLLR